MGLQCIQWVQDMFLVGEAVVRAAKEVNHSAINSGKPHSLQLECMKPGGRLLRADDTFQIHVHNQYKRQWNNELMKAALFAVPCFLRFSTA